MENVFKIFYKTGSKSTIFINGFVDLALKNKQSFYEENLYHFPEDVRHNEEEILYINLKLKKLDKHD